MTSIQILLEAIRSRDGAAVRRLIDAEPELVGMRGENGENPLMTAIYHDAGGVLAMLIVRGAEMDVFAAAAVGNSVQLAELCDEDPERPHAYSYDGWTPLHLAAFFGQADAAELLLARGADVHARSRNDAANTPLHAALAGRANTHVIEILLSHLADVNARGGVGVTPLHLAASRGNAEVIQLLLGRGALPIVRMDDGTTPAAMAESRGYKDVATLLQTRAAAPEPSLL